MATVLYDRDANMKVLEGKTVAVLGYGSQDTPMPRTCATAGSPWWWGFMKEANPGRRPRGTALRSIQWATP